MIVVWCVFLARQGINEFLEVNNCAFDSDGIHSNVNPPGFISISCPQFAYIPMMSCISARCVCFRLDVCGGCQTTGGAHHVPDP